MTRRERIEAKIAKRREWAEGRASKSAALLKRNEPYHGDIAFNTQPGHIPERARAIRRSEKAWEHQSMATRHDQVASTLEHQLARSIFSDDTDAVEALQARIAELERKRAAMREVNRLYRKGDAEGLRALGHDLESLRRQVAAVGYSWVRAPYERYELSNLGGRIKAARDRLVAVQRRQERAAAAESTLSGVSIEGAHDYVSVTFAEKPARAVLDALKGAGFHWRNGSWHGQRARLPEAVREMVAGASAPPAEEVL